MADSSGHLHLKAGASLCTGEGTGHQKLATTQQFLTCETIEKPLQAPSRGNPPLPKGQGNQPHTFFKGAKCRKCCCPRWLLSRTSASPRWGHFPSPPGTGREWGQQQQEVRALQSQSLPRQDHKWPTFWKGVSSLPSLQTRIWKMAIRVVGSHGSARQSMDHMHIPPAYQLLSSPHNANLKSFKKQSNLWHKRCINSKQKIESKQKELVLQHTHTQSRQRRVVCRKLHLPP